MTLLTSRDCASSSHIVNIDKRMVPMLEGGRYLKYRPLRVLDRFVRVLRNASVRNRTITFNSDARLAHLQVYVPLIDQWYALRLASRLPVVITVHNVWRHKDDINNRYAFLRRIYNGVQSLIVHADANKQQLIADFGVPGDNINVIPHGVDAYEPDERIRNAARDALGVSQGQILFLFFGSIRDGKGLDILLEAYALARVANKDITLLVAGDMPAGETFERYRSIMKRLNMENAVRLKIGWVGEDDMRSYFEAADVIVLPYVRYASQSGVLLQAYRYQKPVIVSKAGGMAEIVSTDSAGIVVDASHDEVSCAMMNLALNAEVRREMASNMKSAVLEKYSWDIVAMKTMEVYSKILNLG